MKKLNKKILVLSLILLIGIVTISLNNKKELKVKEVDSKKLAVYIKQEDGSYKASNTIPSIGYTLNNEKSTCSNGARPTWNNNGLNIANLTSNNTNCYLYFDSDVATKKLKELGLTSNTTTPDFSQTATTDEGIFGVEDGMYGETSYYWRGAVTNNYVKFAGKCWRIVRINGDGSMRLIYDGATCHANGTNTADSIAVASTAYNTSYNQSNYVGWTYTGTSQRTLGGTASNAKTQLESWYNSNIGNNTTYSSKIADGKYCNDRNVASGYTWAINGSTFYYAGYKRLYTDYAPTLACNLGDVYTLKVGLITADEVEFAGGKNENNTSYYLYNGQHYWTMSPIRWSGTNAFVFYVDAGGYLSWNNVNNTYDLRPVINLKADTTFTGNGTIDNPFVVEEI